MRAIASSTHHPLLRFSISLFLIAAFAFLAAVPRHGDGKPEQFKIKGSSYLNGKWGAIVHSAQNILAGKSPDKTTITIAPDAYLVAGKRFENLQGVINGEIKGCSLNEGPSRQAVWLHLKANDQENAVVLVLKTQSDKKTDDRFHTVVFMKGTTGQWSVQSWHASE